MRGRYLVLGAAKAQAGYTAKIMDHVAAVVVLLTAQVGRTDSQCKWKVDKCKWKVYNAHQTPDETFLG